MIDHESFLPTTFAGWVAAFGSVLTVVTLTVGGVLRFVRGPIERQINGVGSRVKLLEEGHATNKGEIDMLKRNDERVNFQVQTLTERHGKLESRQEEMDEHFDEFTRKTEVQLGRIEEKIEGSKQQLDRIVNKLYGTAK